MNNRVEITASEYNLEESQADALVTSLEEKDLPEYLDFYKKVISEIPGFTQRERKYFLDNVTEENYKKKLSDPRNIFLITRKDESIVGILEGQIFHYPVLPEPYKTIGYVKQVGVSKDYRRRRIGHALQDAFESSCAMRGVTTLLTFIHDTNIPSISAGQSSGFLQDTSGYFPDVDNGKHYVKFLKKK